MSLQIDREVIYSLRSYQDEVLRLFSTDPIQQKRSLHIVAPPGAGKTIMGIKLMLRFAKKAVILSPNAAIQMQWCDKFYAATDCLDDETSQTSCSNKLEEEPTYLSLTYQSLAVKKGDSLHPNAVALIDRIATSGYELIICDECHHLTGHWAEVVTHLKERINNPFVIGFTATPPLESDKSGMELYLSLLGEVDYSIPQAQLVKEKNLAPFQDLIYLSTPSDEEQRSFSDAQEKLQDTLSTLEKKCEIPLSVWVHDSLERCRFKGKIRSYPKLFKSDIDRPIAFARYLMSRKITLPLEVPELDEMNVPPSADDFALVVGDFLVDKLLPQKAETLIDMIIAAFKRVGFRFTGTRFQPVNSGVVQSLTLSKSKLQGAATIVENEITTLDTAVRVLILVDYEFGKQHTDGINAVDVIDTLTSNEVCDEIDPIMLTGRSVLVDDDLLPLFLDQTEKFRQKENLTFTLKHWPERGYIRVEGEGKDWTSRNYIRLITYLFELGVTRCLISTRSLLGEGWDSVKCNTLIDLTAIAGYISVNQMRGRTLRIDPKDQLKCANNWDVVTIMPGVHFGMHDYHRLKRKFGHFLGISDDGVIEKGLGHVHPLFSETTEGEISSHIETINKAMFKKSQERMQCFKLWEAHEGTNNFEVDSLDLILDEKEKVERSRGVEESIEWMHIEIGKERSKRAKRILPLTILGIGASILFPPNAALLTGYLGLEFFNYKRKVTAISEKAEEKESFTIFLERIAQTVCKTMTKSELLPSYISSEKINIFERSDNCYRIVLNGANELESKEFTNAVWELLGPVQNHRYILASYRYTEDLKTIARKKKKGQDLFDTEIAAYYPLPSILGKKRSIAQTFESFWKEEMGLAKLHYTRSEEGAKVLHECIRKRPLKLTREKKTIWS